jgi:hypothetical protein
VIDLAAEKCTPLSPQRPRRGFDREGGIVSKRDYVASSLIHAKAADCAAIFPVDAFESGDTGILVLHGDRPERLNSGAGKRADEN